MKTSRRAFIAGAVQCSAGVGLTTAGAAQAQAAPADGVPDISYKIHPVGTVEKGDTWTRIRIFDAYVDGLLGLQE